ncbi:MAG: hypothetical protein BAJALOKI3v1_50126 [Promethearchaeota archaeon]|nr:MAG: hypothetical protein BAJALOKI3v1_50126 [Candidatus Lokiarchaeota archaeon]
MPVSYTPSGGTESYLIPAPFVSWSKTNVRGSDGIILHPEYNFTLTGTIVNVGKTLDSTGASGYPGNDMNGVLNEQTRIRNLFTDGGLLKIDAPSTSGHPLLAYCQVDNVGFSPGTWTNRNEYTVSLKSFAVSGESITELAGTSENWSLNEQQNGTYNITHTLEAVGKHRYSDTGSNDALRVARDWCYDHAYVVQSGILIATTASGTNDLFNPDNFLSPIVEHSDQINLTTVDVQDWFHILLNQYGDLEDQIGVSGLNNFYNYQLSENVDPESYTWGLTENFVYNPNGNTREEWELTESFDANNQNQRQITLTGTIFGYEDRITETSGALSNAESEWEIVQNKLYSRAQQFSSSGITINSNPVSKTVTKDMTNGLVRYSWGFLAYLGQIISDALNEEISIVDTAPTDVIALINVPGRVSGPVVQYMETKTTPERQLSIDLLMNPLSSGITSSSLASQYFNKPDVSSIINAVKPNAGYYYISQDTESWNPINRNYSRNVTWVIEPSGITEASSTGIFPDGMQTTYNNTNG